MRWILMLLPVLGALLLCQPCAADELGDFRRLLTRGGESIATRAEPVTLEQLLEGSQWRGYSADIFGGMAVGRRPLWNAGGVFSMKLSGPYSLVARASYMQELGGTRSFRPQVRGGLLETGVRIHLDVHDKVAVISDHAIAGSYKAAYFKKDGENNRVSRASMISLGTTHTLGLEFGDRQWRGYVETGLRTSFPLFVDSDRNAASFRSSLRRDYRFQWIVFRAGVRLYF